MTWAYILGVIVGTLLLVNGFGALRRPLSALVSHDPIGRWLLQTQGEVFALRAYRVFGAVCVLLGMMTLYLSLGGIGL